LAHQHMAEQPGTGHAAFDRAARRQRLRDRAAAATRHLGTDVAHDMEAAGLVVQHFRDVLADLAQPGSTRLAVAAALRRVYHGAPRQMFGQLAQSRTLPGLALLAPGFDRRDVGFVLLADPGVLVDHHHRLRNLAANEFKLRVLELLAG